jgi:small subunit ribosomal protein S17
MKTENKKKTKMEGLCNEVNCPIHGKLRTRGRIFRGEVIRKFEKRITIKFSRKVYVSKYERYTNPTVKIHAKLPQCMRKDINLGDHIEIQECRPLSKIIHFVVLKKIKSKEKDEKTKEKKK